MKNINELRNELANVFSDLRSGKIKPQEASEVNNCAGKIISACKVELEYYALRKEIPKIHFLSNEQVMVTKVVDGKKTEG
jgi:hypothetical protein